MKTEYFRGESNSWRIGWLTVFLGIVTLGSLRAGELPKITGIEIHGTNALVSVSIPKGMRRVTLESKSRTDSGPWTSRELQWPDGKEGNFVFKIPATRDLELLRLNATDTTSLPLPAKFYQGSKNFGSVRQAAGSQGVPPGNVDGNVINLSTGPIRSESVLDGSGARDFVVRQVVESDIWQLRGDTLYFFNQNRGLQVIDVSNPDSPVLRSTLPLAASGEQMYVLDGTREDGAETVALLAANGCDGKQSQVVLVSVKNGVLREQARIPVVGSIQESRLVGTALYIAARHYAEIVPSGGASPGVDLMPQWAHITTIQSFDLANPSAPRIHPAVSLETYPYAIQATDELLMVATTGQRNGPIPAGESGVTNAVHLFDIRDPSGVAHAVGSVVTEGRVADKFKMNVNAGILTVVSQRDPTWNGGNFRPSSTWVETFSLTTLGKPLTQIKLVENENLHATRFDGKRLYVVTFRQVDPLWILDLSNPAKPEILSELEVPGFSTYIHPMGDRLLTMGQDGGAAVSLFDVSNPRKAILVSKVKLGTWSWSEANSDEKAFKVDPEAGLILVPWSGWAAEPGSPGGGKYVSGMQLVDFSPEKLVLRGHISQSFQARRATLHRQRILSISGNELVSVDATHRDQLEVRARLDLAPQVDRVWLSGDYLLSWVQGNIDPKGNSTSWLQVSRTNAPDERIARISLTNVSVHSSDQQSGQLRLILRKPDSNRIMSKTYTNQYLSLRSQPPVFVRTNIAVMDWHSGEPVDELVDASVVEVRGQAPVFGGFSTNVRIIQLPPFPGELEPSWVTNETVEPIWIAQPSLLVTNQLALGKSELSGPVTHTREVSFEYWAQSETTVETNVVVNASQFYETIPGGSLLLVVELGALPQLSVRDFELPAATIAGARFTAESVHILSRGEDRLEFSFPTVPQSANVTRWGPVEWSQRTNEFIKSAEVRSLDTFKTREIVDWIVPAGSYLRTNVSIVQLPPLPGQTGDPEWVTNITVKTVKVTGDRYPVTNLVADVVSGERSWVTVTNRVVTLAPSQSAETELVTANLPQLQTELAPGQGFWTAIRLPASGPLSVTSSFSFEWDKSTPLFGTFEALVPRSGVEAWVVQSQTFASEAFPVAYIDAPIRITALPSIAFRGGATTAFVDDLWIGGGGGIFRIWDPWYSYGNDTLNFLFVDSNVGKYGGNLQLKGTNGHSSTFSRAVAGDGRIFASRRETRYLAPANEFLMRTNSSGEVYKEYQSGSYEHTHRLTVLDFGADQILPTRLPDSEFTGVLKGLSHGGALLYAERGMEGGYYWNPIYLLSDGVLGGAFGMDQAAKPALDALAFDGAAASLVGSLDLVRGPNWAPVYSLRPDGAVWRAVPSLTNGTPAALEVWAVSEDAAWARYQEVRLGVTSIVGLNTVGDAVAADLVDGNVQLLADRGARKLESLRRWNRSCNFWAYWPNAVGGVDDGIWFPRGQLGLWYLPTQP